MCVCVRVHVCVRLRLSRHWISVVLVLAEAFEVLQTIFVHRGEPGSRSNTVNEICRRAKSKDEWPHVLVFPEGTTLNC